MKTLEVHNTKSLLQRGSWSSDEYYLVPDRPHAHAKARQMGPCTLPVPHLCCWNIVLSRGLLQFEVDRKWNGSGGQQAVCFRHTFLGPFISRTTRFWTLRVSRTWRSCSGSTHSGFAGLDIPMVKIPGGFLEWN